MALYTIVDDTYYVELHQSMRGVYDSVRGDDHFLDEDETRPVTLNALKMELKEYGEARIYQTGYRDWYQKVQRQRV